MSVINSNQIIRTIQINLILFFIIFIIIAPITCAQTEKPVKFYLYNPIEIEKDFPILPPPINYSLYGKLNTTPPDRSKENYTYCPTDIENFTYIHGTIGYWFSEPIHYSIRAIANFTVNIWVKSATNITNVTFLADIGLPGQGGYHGYISGIEKQNLSNQPKLLSFSYHFKSMEFLRESGRFKLEFEWNYTPSENPSSDNVTLISFSGDMCSSIQIFLNSVTPKIDDYFIDNLREHVKINTTISDALGITDINNYSLSIIGPIENITVYEENLSKSNYEINSTWIWNYESIDAPSGNYTIIFKVSDNSNNTWEDSTTVFFNLDKIEKEDEKDFDFLTFWITPVIILLTILFVYYALKLRKIMKYNK